MRIALASVVGVLLLTALGMSAADSGPTETCAVELRVLDDASGEVVAAVVQVLDANGDSLDLRGLLPRGRGVPQDLSIHDWYVLPETATCELPREAVTIRAFSGLGTEIAEQTIDLNDQESAVVTLRPDRFLEAHEAGLWNANTHVHLQKVTRTESDTYLVDVGMADGLDLVFVSYLERAEADLHYTSNEYTRAELHALNNHHVHFDHGEEHRHNFGPGGEGYGHVMLLAIPELVYPVSIGPGISKTGTDGLPVRRGIDRAHELGATVIWCHNDWGLEDIPNWLAGRLHANNIFDGGSHGSYEHSFYRYLDCGIKVPFSTGTDWFIYDFSRVYVPSVDRPTPEQWLEQLAAGRSFITNGPLLEFAVNGQGIGEDVSLENPGTLSVTGRAVGRVDFERLEVVLGGKVVQTAESRPAGGHFEAEFTTDVLVDRPTWIALRTPPPSLPDNPDYAESTPVNEYGRELFSHTSASFIDVAGARKFERAAGEALLAEMKESRAFIEQNGLFADDAEKRQVLEVYAEGVADLSARLESP